MFRNIFLDKGFFVTLFFEIQGNFSWGSEAISRKTRIIDVVYNACNNELVRTKTLVKNAIVVIDAAPFRQW